MSRALKLYEMLSNFQDETYSLDELESMSEGSYIPAWVSHGWAFKAFHYSTPELWLNPGDKTVSISAPNGRVALALLLGSTNKAPMEIYPEGMSAEGLSARLRTFCDILYCGTTTQQNAMWEAYCYLFSYASSEREVDKFHLHCIEARGFVFDASKNDLSARHFLKPGEEVSLVRFETYTPAGVHIGHRWMTSPMFQMNGTNHLCQSWSREGYAAKHYFLESWLRAYGVNPEAFARHHSLPLIRKTVVVPEDHDLYFCDGEQYAERVKSHD